MESWIRRIKGIIIFIAFLGMGLSLQLQPPVGVLSAINELGITTTTVTVAFFVSGLMSLLTGLLLWKWNAMWIAVFVFYTVISWAATYTRHDVPTVAPFAYSLTSALLTLDVIIDMVGGWNGRANQKR
jgi:hypothetical protein